MCDAQDHGDARVRQHLNMIASAFAAICTGCREGFLRFDVVFYLSRETQSRQLRPCVLWANGPYNRVPSTRLLKYLCNLCSAKVKDPNQRKGCRPRMEGVCGSRDRGDNQTQWGERLAGPGAVHEGTDRCDSKDRFHNDGPRSLVDEVEW